MLGIRQNRSPTDQTFCIHQTLEKYVNIVRRYINCKVTVLWLVICLVWRNFCIFIEFSLGIASVMLIIKGL